MPVRSSALGASLSARSTITLRWALAYAASLGFPARRFLDDAQPGGLPVVPSFCVCPEWAVMGDPGWSGRLGLSPTEARRRVHALQDSTFHAPMRAGMQVETRGRIAHLRNTSAGAYVETELVTCDADTGALLVTSRSGAIVRGVPLDTAAAGEASGGAPASDGASEAMSVTIPTGIGLPHVYSECAQIWNPIHSERAVALAAGLPDIILHGTIAWALAGKAIAEARAGGDASRLRRLACRFRQPLLQGDAMLLRHAVQADGTTTTFSAANASGAPILAGGLAVLAPG